MSSRSRQPASHKPQDNKAASPILSSRAGLGILLFIALFVFAPLFYGAIKGSATVEALSWVILPPVAVFFLVRTRLLRDPLFVVMGLWLCYLILGYHASEYPYLSAVDFLMFAGWLSVYAISSVLRGVCGRRELLSVLAVSGLLPSFYGLFLFWGNTGSGAERLAVTGTFGLHNPFAGFLLGALPLSIYFLLSSIRQRWIRIFWVAVVLVESAAFVLTLSRAAWICAVIVAIAAVLAPLLGRKGASIRAASEFVLPTAICIAVVFAVIVALKPSSPAILAGHAASIFNKLDYSLQGRLTFWQAGLEIFRDNPVMGTGPGTFANAFTRYQPSIVYFSTDPHSFIVKVLCEQGIIGFAFLALFIWFAVRRYMASGGRDGWLIRSAGLSAIGITLHLAVDFDLSYGVIGWMLMALIAIAGSDGDAPLDGRGKYPPGNAWQSIAPAALILAFVFGVAIFRTPFVYYETRAGSDMSVSDLALDSSASSVVLYERKLGEIGAPEFEGDRTEAALKLNLMLHADARLDKVPRAHFLDGLLCEVLPGGKERAAQEFKSAIKNEPYNFPEYYWEYARWLERQDRPRDAYGVLKDCLTDKMPIVRPITADHVRPTWQKYNPMFGAMWRKLAGYEQEYGDPELARTYDERGKSFGAG